MPRIRSIHPGLFTDEGFVELQPLARLLMIGIWTEADDQGLFEWKPTTLKMRLLPVDHVDVGELLDELASAGFLKRFEHGGKPFGAVRNFRKFQRPKKPNAIHPLPSGLKAWVGLDGDSSEPKKLEASSSSEPKPSSCKSSSEPETPSDSTSSEPSDLDEAEVPNSGGFKRGAIPQKGEIAPQMEDGGGREGGEETPNLRLSANGDSAVPPSSLRSEDGAQAPSRNDFDGLKPPGGDWGKLVFGKGLEWLKRMTPKSSEKSLRGLIARWSRDLGKQDDELWSIFVTARSKEVADPASYIAAAVRDRKAEIEKNGRPRNPYENPPPLLLPVHEWPSWKWDTAVANFVKNGREFWVDRYGPKPDEPGCKAPPEVLRKHGFAVQEDLPDMPEVLRRKETA